MKSRFFVMILIVALFVSSTAMAETANKDLPTKGVLGDYLQTIKPADNYTKISSEKMLNDHPDWKWDIWKTNQNETIISFYYTNPKSENGYGSLYFDGMGSDITSGITHICGLKLTCVKSYKGIEPQEVKEAPVCEVNNSSVVTENVTNVSEVNNTSKTPDNLSFELKVRNDTSGESASIGAHITQPSKSKIDEISESIKHLFYAIFGGN